MSMRPQASRHQFGVASFASTATRSGPFAQYSTPSQSSNSGSQAIANLSASTWVPVSSDPQWSQRQDKRKFAEDDYEQADWKHKVLAVKARDVRSASKAPPVSRTVHLPVVCSSDPNEKPDIITSKAELVALKIKDKAVKRMFAGAKKATWYKMVRLPVDLSSDPDEPPEIVTFAPALGGHTRLKASMLRATRLECTPTQPPPEKLFGSMPVDVELAAARVFSSASALAMDDARFYLRPDASCAEFSRPTVTQSLERVLQKAHVRRMAELRVVRGVVQKMRAAAAEKVRAAAAEKMRAAAAEKLAARKRTRDQEEDEEVVDETVNSAESRGSVAKRPRLSIEKAAEAKGGGTDVELQGPSQESQVSKLLLLPPELRNQIYGLLLVEADPIDVTPSSGAIQVPPLLQVCRSMRKEALPIYYGSNDFTALVHDANTAYLCRWLNMIGVEGGSELQRIEIRCSGRFVCDGAVGDQANPCAHYFLALATHLRASTVCRDAVEMRTTFYEEHDVYEVQGDTHLFSDLRYEKRDADDFHKDVRLHLRIAGYEPMPTIPRCRSCRGLKYVSTIPPTGDHVRGMAPLRWPILIALPSASGIVPYANGYDNRLHAYTASYQVYKSCIRRTQSQDPGPLSSKYYFDWAPLKKFEYWSDGKYKPVESDEDASG